MKMEVIGPATIFTLHAIFPSDNFETNRKAMANQLREIADALEQEHVPGKFKDEHGWGWYNWSYKNKRQRTTFESIPGRERKFSESG